MAGLIARWRKRLTGASAEAVPEVTGADVKESDGYIYYSDEEEIDEAVAIARQKMSAHHRQGEAVPIALTVDLERLIESRRIRGDQNFEGGSI